LTEAGPNTFWLPPEDVRRKPGAVGFPLFHIDVRVVREDGSPCESGEPGELIIRGPHVTPGYWNNPEATSELIQDGWLRTGDVGRKDKWGRLFFVDRVKDVIKCGGYSVFSVEVEKEVLNHPDVADAAVVGIPHPLKKQVPLAVVTVRPGSQATEEDILAWCKENIALYKSPRAVRIIAPEEMPYGMTLKVRKLELRDRFADLFTGESV
jgi:fatty-acyl-CoA synthase